MADVRVAVIGAGYWGKNLVRNFKEVGALYGVADPDPKRLGAMKEAHGEIEVSTDASEMMSRDEVTAVAIAAPAEMHAQLVAEALSKGKHVFVEKPLCLDVDEGRELVRRADEAGLILMVGHLLHYHPAVVKLKSLVEEGRLGRLQYIYSNRLSLGKFRSEENIVWSFAPHDISLTLALTQEMPDAVTAFGGNYLQNNIADVTVSTLSFPSGVKAHIFVNWLHPFKEQKLVVVGDAGMAVFNDVEPVEKLLVYPHRIHWQHRQPVPEKAEAEVIETGKAEPLRNECLHFLESVQTGLPPTTDGREGLAVLAVLDACQQSLNMGGGVVKPGLSELGVLQERGYSVHPTAIVDDGCSVGAGSKIWHFAHVIKGTRVGEGCNLGQNVMAGPNVTIGNRVKIQNNVSVYEGVTLEDEVFCGPSMVFTNVHNPRAFIVRKDEIRKTLVRRGASLGANSTIVCGNTVGRYAFVGAGAVVTRDVPDHALVVGNPAARIGWMCQCGVRLHLDEDLAKCQACNREYKLEDGKLREV